MHPDPRRTALVEQVYRDHAMAIARYFARRTVAGQVEDLVAETFVVAFRKLPADCAEPLPWLYAVAHRLLLNHRRRASAGRALVGRLSGRTAPAAAGPEEHASAGALKPAFERLSAREREAICLIAWEGLTHEQAAQVLGCSVATLTVRLSRARAKLRALLADDHHHAPRTRALPDPTPEMTA